MRFIEISAGKIPNFAVGGRQPILMTSFRPFSFSLFPLGRSLRLALDFTLHLAPSALPSN